jgi:hypothetical protein
MKWYININGMYGVGTIICQKPAVGMGQAFSCGENNLNIMD